MDRPVSFLEKKRAVEVRMKFLGRLIEIVLYLGWGYYVLEHGSDYKLSVLIIVSFIVMMSIYGIGKLFDEDTYY